MQWANCCTDKGTQKLVSWSQTIVCTMALKTQVSKRNWKHKVTFLFINKGRKWYN